MWRNCFRVLQDYIGEMWAMRRLLMKNNPLPVRTEYLRRTVRKLKANIYWNNVLPVISLAKSGQMLR